MTTAPFTFAETVVFSSANCHVKSGHAEVVYASGIVENRTGNYDQLYCNIPVKKGKDIIEVGVNMYLLRKKSNHGARCTITFYHEGSNSIITSERTEHAQDRINYLTMVDFMLSDYNNAGRGLLSCSLPGVEENGLSRITSYVVTYSD